MLRRGISALALTFLLDATAARGATFLYLRGEPGDFVGDAVTETAWLDESTATVAAGQLNPGTFAFSFDVPFPGKSWALYWTTNFGGAFAPGIYEIPGFVGVSGDGRFCAPSGRIVVHEVALEGTEVKSAALDFELHCDGGTQGGLFGSLRYRTGDTVCADAEDGTPCDDRDQCTSAATCVGGRCTASAARPVCPPDTVCTLEAPCDPADGTCPASPTAPWGESCDDGNACTLGGICFGNGTCVGEPLDCDDASPCTTDSCDGATGCVHTPLAEQCWAIASRAIARVTASGTIRGHQVRCSGKCASESQQLLLIDGELYRIPSGTAQCANGEPFDGADETGTLVPARHGRTAFALDNLEQLKADLLFCTGARLKDIRRTMSVDPGRGSLSGVERVRSRLPERIPTRLTITSAFNGAPFVADQPHDVPPFPNGRPAPDCASGIRIRCKVD